MKFRAVTLTLLFLFPTSLLAIDKDVDEKAFCDRFHSCSMEKLKEEGDDAIPAAQMEPMLKSMCDRIITNMRQKTSEHKEMKVFSSACLKSMGVLSCSELMEEDGVKTPACDKLEAEAEKRGIETS